VDDFRETGRKGTYIPVWGHGEAEESRPAVRLALYRAAAVMWTEAGCKTHGAGYLPVDEGAERFWFWNGFGLTGVDAIRPMQPIEVACPAGLAVRKARVDDAPAVALLESEHMRHYSAPPVWMTVRHPVTAEGYAEFLSSPQNAVYLAEAGGEPVGYIRFEAKSSGATEIVQSEGTVAISAGYTRARRRGQGTAGAILDAALQDYAAAGYERCSVDFESFNPQASAFWLRYPESMVG
jgi:ribosomal protein S18 acetylase RimI-like enzyme